MRPGEIRFAATPRKADYAWTTLARIMLFAKDRGTIATNPCENGGRLYSADRTDKVWGEPEIAVVLSVASSDIKLALVLALWTGQRTFCDRHGRRTTAVTFGKVCSVTRRSHCSSIPNVVKNRVSPE